MAVQNRTGAPDGKIMLLVGPPGVGKTSIAQSVAKATGREYIRISLGGVHKESDIRGHSSTFVGAMPGRIIQEIRKAKSMNALVVLDEIDKLGQHSGNGDPSAALLEVLDPAQNHTFRDDYLGVEFDLSKILFFATANDFWNIPGPLRDRMQVIHLRGYTKDEKFEIAQRYLVPKQMKAKKLSDEEVIIQPETIRTVIKDHTAEAGVRSLEKKIGEICGKAVVDIAKGKEGLTTVTPDNLETYIGIGRGEREKIPAQDSIGIVSGLFYSSVGGGILPIEASLMPSPGGFRMTVSGSLGKVMGESAGVAERLIRTRAPDFGISDAKIFKAELSVHCPDGATPKDGPSAGAAFTTAIISTFTGIPIRRDVAMTGEINSKGQVTAIGGLPEKLEGALEAGVKTVLIPKENIPNLAEVSDKVKSQLTIIPVGTIEEVLKHALTEEIKPLVTAAPPAPALGFWPRLRKAWDVVAHGTPSNDNKPPEAVRQAAGARRNDPAP
jgi:ATP-dependent Lon protease